MEDPITANTAETAMPSAAPANNTLAPVLNNGTLDLSLSKLNALTLNTIQTKLTTAKSRKIALRELSADEVNWVVEAGVEVKFGI